LIRRKPQEFRQLMAREGELAFDVGAGVALAEARRFLQRDAALEIRDEMRHAMRAHDRQRGIELALAQRIHFLERAGEEHRVEALVDGRVQRRARRRDEQAEALLRIEQRLGARSLKGCERLASRSKNFERAQNALWIARP
jgi:hypothetical protein